jgi:hypothetical protein
MDIGLQGIYFLSHSYGLFLTLKSPLSRLRLERQTLGDEDCLSAESASSAVTTRMRR